MLRDLINSLGLTGTAAEIAAALNAKTVQVPISGRKTWSDIAAEIGPEKTQQFYVTLDQLGLKWVRETLSGAGIDFSNPQTQQMIRRFQEDNVISAEEAIVLKGLGVKTLSPYERLVGEGQVVTEEQVAAAMTPVMPDGEQRMLSVVVQADNHVTATLIVQPTYQGKPCGRSEVRQYVGDEAVSLREIVQSLTMER